MEDFGFGVTQKIRFRIGNSDLLVKSTKVVPTIHQHLISDR
jgi:hypothetical protein